ncbi:MAG: sortase-like acyltransferase [Marmoricola sp.]|nr:sortase-like acyltransferase [Marmoricola sp.]
MLRPATPADAAGCREVYTPYVVDTAVSFETEPPSVAEMAERISAALAGHAWLVLEEDGRIVGYAYGGPFRTRVAYRWSCETSIYLEAGRHRAGAGRTLYADLLARLAARGFRTALAAMTVPNPASEGFHRHLGFTEVGTFHRVGHKFGAWHDVLWMERRLDDRETAEPG